MLCYRALPQNPDALRLSQHLKARIDQALVDRGLCEPRSQAQCSIMAGQVRTNGHPARKPSEWLRHGDWVELRSGGR